MRVAYDMTPAGTGSTGIAMYLHQVRAALERAGVAVQPYAIGRLSIPLGPDVRHLRVPLRVVHRAWRVVERPRLRRTVAGADVVHATDISAPVTRQPSVVFISDFLALDLPELHPSRSVAVQREMLRTATRAAVVMTSCDATANAMRAHGVEQPIVVTRLGCPPAAPAEALPPGIPPAGFVLALGEAHRRKGLPVLAAALAQLPPSVHVVHAGPDGPGADELAASIERNGVGARFHRLGAVSPGVKTALLDAAGAFCMPSWGEGFGIPLLEAMAAGTPIVASDIPPHREVSGGHATLVPAGAADELASALDTVLRHRPSAQEIDAGRAWSAGHTWDKTASKTIEAYRIALAGTT